MARISGTDIPDHKKVPYALRTLFGVGLAVALKLVAQTKIDPNKRARDLTNDEVARLQKALEMYPVEGDLRRMINDNIDRLKRIGAYRGLRHRAGLPVRGQRTRSNARTKRGKRHTVGAMAKEEAPKAAAK